MRGSLCGWQMYLPFLGQLHVLTESSAPSSLRTVDSHVVWGALLPRTLSWNPSLDSPALLGAGDIKHHDINHFLLAFARVSSIVLTKDE